MLDDITYCKNKYHPLTPWLKRGACAAHLVTAERIAHTLKALASNLGATLLPECADRLEWALRNGAPEQ